MLGRLEQIANIRTSWPHEASDFTPWLCCPNNLSILSEALGMGRDGLEFEASEAGVGPFRADILCKNTLDDSWVLIENQFGPSDHDHLGKLLTYASGLDAKTVILIGEQIRAEHRKALDWLNGITGEDHDFFACELELWRIGDSLPAPRFNVVVQPNDWGKAVASAKQNIASGELGRIPALQLRYWSAVEGLIRERRGPLKPVKPPAGSWVGHGIGRAGVGLNFAMSTRENLIRVEIYLRGPHAKSHYAQLEAHREAIEAQLNVSLLWQPLPDKKDARISLSLKDADPIDEADWPRQHEWLVDMMVCFHDVFKPFVMNLSRGQQSPETIEAIE